MKITQYGKELDVSKYNWDKETKTFSTKESNLVLDFSDYDGITFKTGANCTFNTGDDCTFNTGSGCTFKTGPDCTFNTGDSCTFFDTGSDCNFKTGSNCTFETSYGCTFNTGPNCTFHTGYNCFCIRYDVKGITEIPEGKRIKLNNHTISGYTFIDEPKIVSCAGKVVEIDGKKYKLVESN